MGKVVVEDREFKYIGWNYPAHQLTRYGSPSAVASAAKRLMTGGNDQSQTAAVKAESLEWLSPSSCIPDGMTFTSQRALMRFLVGRLGYNEDAVCGEYAEAERRGRVPRTSDKYRLSPEQYAHRLYSDGIRKRWL